jgi:hypothetical protein
MIHIKRYNESKDTKFYSELGEVEFYNSTIGGEIDSVSIMDEDKFIAANWIPFTKDEIGIIKKTFSNSELSLNPHGMTFGGGCYLCLYLNFLRLDVYKLKEEWYYVIESNRYYKCDQFEGLMQLLKNINK